MRAGHLESDIRNSQRTCSESTNDRRIFMIYGPGTTSYCSGAAPNRRRASPTELIVPYQLYLIVPHHASERLGHVASGGHPTAARRAARRLVERSEEHTSELQSLRHLV